MAKEEKNSSFRIEEIVPKLLDAHRKGHRDHQATVDNLHGVYKTLGTEGQRQFTELLWNIYSREPLLASKNTSHFGISVSAVILVALVRFGPINEIAPQILGHLQTLDLGAMEEWARTVCPPFQYELY